MAIDKSDYPNKVESNLWADRKYEVFFFNFMYEKKRYRGLIDLSDKVGWSKRDRVSVAKARMIEKKSGVRESAISDRISLDAYMAKYFSHMPDSEHTKIKQSYYERYISPWIGKKRVVDLRQLHIRDVIKKQESKGLSPRTVKRTLEVLGPAMREAIANRLIAFNPLEGIKVKQPKTKKIVTRAGEKLVEIHGAIRAEFSDDPYYLAFFLFALQGRRKSEILKLRWEDVSFGENYYVLRNTKNNEEQKIFLPESIKEQLAQFREDAGWVFRSPVTGKRLQGIRRPVERLKKRLGDPGFGVHYLRNVIVSAMAEQGFDSIHLSGALGHADPTTINKYLTMNYLKSSEMASGVIDGIVKKD
jgi:integrase